MKTMENDSPNLFDSEPMSVRLEFPEDAVVDQDDVLADILEEIREDDHRRPPVVENTVTNETAADSDVDEPPVDDPEYHTDDSDDEDGGGTADDPSADAILDQSTESRKEDSPGAKTKDVHKGLPTGRVKLIMKMDPDVNIVAGDAVFLLTKATVSHYLA